MPPKAPNEPADGFMSPEQGKDIRSENNKLLQTIAQQQEATATREAAAEQRHNIEQAVAAQRHKEQQDATEKRHQDLMAQNQQLLAALIVAISARNASAPDTTPDLANTVDLTPPQSPPMAIEPKQVELNGIETPMEIELEQVEITGPTKPRQVELNGLDITMEIEPEQVELMGLVKPEPEVERLEPEEVITPDSNLGMWLQILLVKISKPEGWAVAIGVLRPSGGPGPPMDEPLPMAQLQKKKTACTPTEHERSDGENAKLMETTTGSTVGGVGGV